MVYLLDHRMVLQIFYHLQRILHVTFYTQGQGLQTLEQAVHSVTGLPAEMSGIDGIGCLKEGAHADICVFDYAALGADSDYLHPFRKNRGLSYVVVNGKVAVENGESNGVKNGRVLKKAPKA